VQQWPTAVVAVGLTFLDFSQLKRVGWLRKEGNQEGYCVGFATQTL
jgi:hypothetical protein